MKVRFNYFLKIKKIMEKDFEIFEVKENSTLKNIIQNNFAKDKLEQIDLSEILIICDGKNIDDLNLIVDKECVFTICPKIYGG